MIKVNFFPHREGGGVTPYLNTVNKMGIDVDVIQVNTIL